MNVLTITISTLVCSLFLSEFSVCAQEHAYEPVTFHPLAENLFEIRGGAGAHGGLFIGASEALLIDSKMNSESVGQVLTSIKKRTNTPVRWLINTHSDRDHVGGNRYLPPGLIIIAHENCRKEMLSPDGDGNPSEWDDPVLSDFLPSLTFTDKMTIHLGKTAVELWHFGPGHTTGDIVVYFPHIKTAFAGDQIRFGRPQLIHSYKGGNSFGHVKNLTRMLDTLKDAEMFCSGHNDPASRADVERHITQMKDRQKYAHT